MFHFKTKSHGHRFWRSQEGCFYNNHEMLRGNRCIICIKCKSLRIDGKLKPIGRLIPNLGRSKFRIRY